MKMYLPVRQDFGDIEISPLSPAQHTREAADNVTLNIIRKAIADNTGGAVNNMQPWQVQFMVALGAQNTQAAWDAANAPHAATRGASVVEAFFDTHFQIIEIEVNA